MHHDLLEPESMRTASVPVPAVVEDDSRLAQLERAQAEDRAWRKTRPEAVERQIRRGMWIAMAVVVVVVWAWHPAVVAPARQTLKQLTPGTWEYYLAYALSHSLSLSIPVFTFIFGSWVSRLREGLKVYTSDTSEPAAEDARTGAVVHSRQEAAPGRLRS